MKNKAHKLIKKLNGKNNKENDLLALKYLEEIKDEVDNKMIELGLMREINGEKIPLLGSCHTRWKIEKEILKDRYNINWKTPSERNPFIRYD